MKTNKIFTLLLLMFSSFWLQAQFETYYNQAIQSPNLKSEFCEGKVQIVHLYKQQIKTLYEGRDLNRKDFTEKYLKEVYFPYKELWTAFFKKEAFIEWMKVNWDVLHNPDHRGIKLPFQLDFDSIFKVSMEKVYSLIHKEPIGKWYLCYGTGGDIVGIMNKFMMVNLISIGERNGEEHLNFILPHEINHQVYNHCNHESWNLLRVIVSEGLSCYLNYLFWDKNYSPAKCIDFTDQEWDYAIQNEAKIFAKVKEKLQSTNRAEIDKFARANTYIWENSPDRLAYFIGLRIIQAYVEKNGADSWKEIYDLPLSEVLQKSDYENFIK